MFRWAGVFLRPIAPLWAHSCSLSSRFIPAATPFSETHLIAGTPRVLAGLTAGLWGIAAGVFFFIPPKTLRELLKSVDSAWIYAVLRQPSSRAGAGGGQQTFVETHDRLDVRISPVASKPLGERGVVAVPATGTLGTQRFAVEIAPACSGLEGVGLMLIFSVLWLWCFRNDYRFPRALLLIPIGIVAIFILNSVRIAALILIGDAGATTVALGGFHSQAGWIAFNGVALGLASLAHRVPYLSSGPKPAVTEGAHIHPDAYLAPFYGDSSGNDDSRAHPPGVLNGCIRFDLSPPRPFCCCSGASTEPSIGDSVGLLPWPAAQSSCSGSASIASPEITRRAQCQRLLPYRPLSHG